MVRRPTQERTRLYRYFEGSATGLMMPLISDAEDAQYIVHAVKFPPVGNRGLDGAGLDDDFGLGVWSPDSTYTDDANRETFIAIQIETPEALENVEKIAAVQGVDALFVGPGDLGLRLSQRESGTQMSLDGTITRVSDAAKKHDIAWGIPAGTPELIEQYRKMGAQLLAYGGDFALTVVLERSSQDFDKALGE